MFKRRLAISRAAVLILLTALGGPLAAYSDPDYDPIIYKGKFFVLLEPAGPFEPDVYDEEFALNQVLEEAQYVFSAMIYGFKFSYVPKDNIRGIEEEFVCELNYLIPWGDPNLTVSKGRYKYGRYDVELSYNVSESQLPWVISWDTNILPEAGAVGSGSLYSGLDGKLEAINNSVKQSLRNHLRPLIYDKPHRISGYARLAEVPYMVADSGKYLCTSKVTLRLEEILEYEFY